MREMEKKVFWTNAHLSTNFYTKSQVKVMGLLHWKTGRSAREVEGSL